MLQGDGNNFNSSRSFYLVRTISFLTLYFSEITFSFCNRVKIFIKASVPLKFGFNLFNSSWVLINYFSIFLVSSKDKPLSNSSGVLFLTTINPNYL